MRVINVVLIASALFSFVWSLIQVILGNPVSPWTCLLASFSTLIGFVGWVREEARADRWMSRAVASDIALHKAKETSK